MDRNFQSIETNGITLRVVIEGDGPLVVLLHGWPQCWYLWRHQIDPLVRAGYRVAVPDQRGYGGSDCPEDVEAFGIRELAGDVRGIAEALGYREFVVIGHDWGCIVAWNTALLHADACRAVMGLSVPFWRVGPEIVSPEGMDEQFWYIRYFQEPGVAERELDRDLGKSLLTIHASLAGDADPQTAWMQQGEFPRGAGLLDTLPQPKGIPAWMSQEDLDTYVEIYRRHGFRGGLNWYRNIPTNSERTPELEGRRFAQPAAFVAGRLDNVLLYDPEWREPFEASFDDLRFLTLIDGAGHWVQAEKPEETNREILRFLKSVDG